MEKTIICSCDDGSSASRVLHAMEIISHALLFAQSKKVHGKETHFITTSEELSLNEKQVLSKLGEMAVQANRIYKDRPKRQYCLVEHSGDLVDIEIIADNPYDALEEALSDHEVSISKIDESEDDNED